MRKRLLLVLLVYQFAMVGCKESPSSKIVAEVEAAGSGPLNGVDETAIQAWLAKHETVAQRVAPECSAAAKQRAAQWTQTTEGKLCQAVGQVLFFKTRDATDGHY
jgi:hypothetical protein